MCRNIQNRPINSQQIWEEVVIFNESRTEVEFESSCRTFAYFYRSVFKAFKASRRDHQKLKRIKCSYDLFLDHTFEKFCQILEVSSQINSLVFENVLQEDKFYLSILQLQRNRKDLKISLNFGNENDVLVIGKRSRLMYTFTEILKIKNEKLF